MCLYLKILNVLDNVAQLKTNHRSEGHLIFDNAERIRNQEMPLFSSAQGFNFITTSDPDGIHEKIIPGLRVLSPVAKKTDRCPLDWFDIVRPQMYAMRVSREKQEIYASLIRTHKTAFGIKDPEKSQMIAFLNAEGKMSREDCADFPNQFRSSQELFSTNSL